MGHKSTQAVPTRGDREKQGGVQSTRAFLRILLVTLFAIFCFAYPLGVIGVAFDVPAPFSLGLAGSVLLFLEGTLLIVAAMLVYDPLRALVAGLLVIVLSYLVETIGVNTRFPFGAYRYTETLLPKLPGGVPFAVMCAWVLIVLGAYSWVRSASSGLSIGRVLLGSTLATLLDLAIEPVAFHVVRYWQWLSPGPINYYGVPLANFVAWFVVTFLLLLLVDSIFFYGDKEHKDPDQLHTSHLAALIPHILFVASLFMFGLVDLTHGYYGGTLLALLAGVALWWLPHTHYLHQ